MHGDCSHFLFMPVLLFSPVFFSDSLFAFGKISFFQVFEFAKVGKEPCDQVHIRRECILDLDCQFALWVLSDQLSNS